MPRRQRAPAHGHFALPPPRRPVRHRPVGRQIPYRPDPALPGARTRRRAPRAAQARSKSRRKACTGSPGTLRWIRAFGRRSARSEGRSREPSRVAKVTVRGPSGPERDPHVPAPDLVAGALDQQPGPRRASRAHSRCPDRGDLGLVVLPQHVRRADQRRPLRHRDLEAAVPEGEPLALVRLRRRDPGRIDLDAHHARARRHGTQPRAAARRPSRARPRTRGRPRRGRRRGAGRRRAWPRSSGPCGAAGWGWWSRASPCPGARVACAGSVMRTRVRGGARHSNGVRRAGDRAMIWQRGNERPASAVLALRSGHVPGTCHALSEEERTREPVRRPGSAAAGGTPREPATPGRSLGRRRRPRRVAMLSVHTSPLHQPGTGDAGGMNVYIVELAQRLAAINIEVEIFTRATTGGAAARRSSWRPASSSGTSTPAPTRASPRRTCPPSCAPSPTA